MVGSLKEREVYTLHSSDAVMSLERWLAGIWDKKDIQVYFQALYLELTSCYSIS